MAAPMRKVMRCMTNLRILRNKTLTRQHLATAKFATDITTQNHPKESHKSFTDMFSGPDLFEQDDESMDETTEGEAIDKTPASFATLFRHSKFVQLGNLKQRNLIGRIFLVNGDDLYIDFGGKFMCCCPRPSHGSKYLRGERVKVCLHEFELASKFMGSDTAVSLLEANCTLLGKLETPKPKVAAVDDLDFVFEPEESDDLSRLSADDETMMDDD